jgi:hypothetical protein
MPFGTGLYRRRYQASAGSSAQRICLAADIESGRFEPGMSQAPNYGLLRINCEFVGQ